MYTVLLRHKGKPVCAATLRVFGPQLAEMPLVATKQEARRQGHARVIVRAIEALLADIGVDALSLPSAQDTLATWIHGFGFTHMPMEQEERVKKELPRMLVFPGTHLLLKRVSVVAARNGATQLLPGAAALAPAACAAAPGMWSLGAGAAAAGSTGDVQANGLAWQPTGFGFGSCGLSGSGGASPLLPPVHQDVGLLGAAHGGMNGYPAVGPMGVNPCGIAVNNGNEVGLGPAPAPVPVSPERRGDDLFGGSGAVGPPTPTTSEPKGVLLVKQAHEDLDHEHDSEHRRARLPLILGHPLGPRISTAAAAGSDHGQAGPAHDDAVGYGEHYEDSVLAANGSYAGHAPVAAAGEDASPSMAAAAAHQPVADNESNGQGLVRHSRHSTVPIRQVVWDHASADGSPSHRQLADGFASAHDHNRALHEESAVPVDCKVLPANGFRPNDANGMPVSRLSLMRNQLRQPMSRGPESHVQPPSSSCGLSATHMQHPSTLSRHEGQADGQHLTVNRRSTDEHSELTHLVNRLHSLCEPLTSSQHHAAERQPSGSALIGVDVDIRPIWTLDAVSSGTAIDCQPAAGLLQQFAAPGGQPQPSAAVAAGPSAGQQSQVNHHSITCQPDTKHTHELHEHYYHQHHHQHHRQQQPQPCFDSAMPGLLHLASEHFNSTALAVASDPYQSANLSVGLGAVGHQQHAPAPADAEQPMVATAPRLLDGHMVQGSSGQLGRSEQLHGSWQLGGSGQLSAVQADQEVLQEVPPLMQSAGLDVGSLGTFLRHLSDATAAMPSSYGGAQLGAEHAAQAELTTSTPADLVAAATQPASVSVCQQTNPAAAAAAAAVGVLAGAEQSCARRDDNHIPTSDQQEHTWADSTVNADMGTLLAAAGSFDHVLQPADNQCVPCSHEHHAEPAAGQHQPEQGAGHHQPEQGAGQHHAALGGSSILSQAVAVQGEPHAPPMSHPAAAAAAAASASAAALTAGHSMPEIDAPAQSEHADDIPPDAVHLNPGTSATLDIQMEEAQPESALPSSTYPHSHSAEPQARGHSWRGSHKQQPPVSCHGGNKGVDLEFASATAARIQHDVHHPAAADLDAMQPTECAIGAAPCQPDAQLQAGAPSAADDDVGQILALAHDDAKQIPMLADGDAMQIPTAACAKRSRRNSDRSTVSKSERSTSGSMTSTVAGNTAHGSPACSLEAMAGVAEGKALPDGAMMPDSTTSAGHPVLATACVKSAATPQVPAIRVTRRSSSSGDGAGFNASNPLLSPRSGNSNRGKSKPPLAKGPNQATPKAGVAPSKVTKLQQPQQQLHQPASPTITLNPAMLEAVVDQSNTAVAAVKPAGTTRRRSSSGSGGGTSSDKIPRELRALFG